MTEPEMTEPENSTTPDAPATTFDARTGSGDPRTDPAALGETRLHEQDADGGATPGAADQPEPDTG